MTVIATCGHKIPDGRYDICHAWNGTTKDGVGCIDYGSLCEECEKQYKIWGILIKITKPTEDGEVVVWDYRCKNESR